MSVLDSKFCYNFQTSLEIKPKSIDYSIDNTFIYVVNIINSWAARTCPQLGIPKHLKTYVRDDDSRKVNIIFDYDDKYYCLRLTHSDTKVADRTWITEAVVSKINDRLMLGVRNGYKYSYMPYNIEEYTLYSYPNFMKILETNVKLLDGGQSTGTVSSAYTQDNLIDLFELVCNHDRQLPVIIITENTYLDDTSSSYFNVNDEHDIGYIVDGNKLADRTKFIAHVFYMPNRFTSIWEQLVGTSLSVYGGAIRTYNPGFSEEDDYSEHPLASPKYICAASCVGDNKDYIGGQAFRHILQRKTKIVNMHRRFGWKEIGHVFYLEKSEQLISQKNKQEYNDQEWIKALSEDNDLLKQRIDSIQSDLDQALTENLEQEQTIRKLKSLKISQDAQISKLRYSLEKAKAQDMVFPTTYLEIPKWVEDNFKGTLELTSRAQRCLKDANYQNIELVCKALQWLATSYHSIKAGLDTISNDECLKELAALELINAPVGNGSVSKALEDEYYVTYAGKRRFLESHLKKGNSRDSQEILRIYYFWDDDSNQVIVGSLPGHLHNSMS